MDERSFDVSDVQKKLLDFCALSPNGLSDDELQKLLPTTNITSRVSALNNLLADGKIIIFKQNDKLLYRAKTESSASPSDFSDSQEQLIYQIIEQSGDKGIWVRDIRYKSSLLQAQVNKVLKILENKKLVKAVHSVGAAKRKIYMLYDVAPDKSLTGGSWYSDQEFETEFVDILNQQCFRFLENRRLSVEESNVQSPLAIINNSFASSEEVCKFIQELGISKIHLGIEDIETILDTLVYDGKAVKDVISDSSGKSKNVYRSCASLLKNSGLVRSPCGICPVFKDCQPGGVVSPETCAYLKDWLA